MALDRRRFLLTAAGGVLLTACGGGQESAAPRSGSAAPSPSPTGGAVTPGSTAPEPAPPTTTTPDYPDGLTPARLRIPSIGVDASVVELQLTGAEVEVPSDFATVGWWVQTRRPGQIGPSVMGGHVDSTAGPAVFFRLTELVTGDTVVVVDPDGAEVTFVVDRGVQVDKQERPPEVFGFGEPRPELRLITCTGDFDPAAGSYEDNYVVFAHQEGVTA